MDKSYKEALQSQGSDINAAIERVAGSEDIYERILKKFLLDPNFLELKKCFDSNDFSNAFLYAHTIKGLTANLGLMRLSQLVEPIVELLRNNVTTNIHELFPPFEAEYEAICQIIKDNS